MNRIILVTGGFDPIHSGHIAYLSAARRLGDMLIVGINSDASVKRLKGNSRPINNQHIRAEQLKCLPWVDDVIVFDNDTPYELIKDIHPDIIVKGGDYTIDTVVGNDLANVHIVPTIEGYSTTNIIKEIK